MPENKLSKGDFAIAHIEKTYQSLLAGRGVYSRYFVVEVLSSTREGLVKTFRDNNVTSAPSHVDRFTTIYSFPAASPKL